MHVTQSNVKVKVVRHSKFKILTFKVYLRHHFKTVIFKQIAHIQYKKAVLSQR